MLNIVNVGYDSTNYYVIESATTRLLVDVGFPGTLAKLRHALTRTGLALEAIGYLLATHYHPDHAGLAEEVKQHGIPLLVLESQTACIPRLKQLMKPQYHYREITSQNMLTMAFAQSRAFLNQIGIAGEIIPTPGHSDDSVTLILDAGMAFTGDLAAPIADNTNQQLQQSWHAIRAHNVQTVYPGHGPTLSITDQRLAI